jgi:hypothetical protein
VLNRIFKNNNKYKKSEMEAERKEKEDRERRHRSRSSKGRKENKNNNKFWEELIAYLSVCLSVCLANCCWPSPAESFLAASPAGLMTIFHCLTTLGVLQLHSIRLLAQFPVTMY